MYDSKQCDPEFEALEARCAKLGDAAMQDEECMAGLQVAIQLGLAEDPSGLALLGSEGLAQKTGFNWTAATVGAGVGFVAGAALMKMRRGRKDDEFSRV